MQISLFDIGCEKLKINKPIRLIELFGGYGSQALALKYLGIEFEHHKLCEWAVKSIQAYKDLHFGGDNDYSKDLSYDEIVDYLFKRGISADYSAPMTRQQIKRMGEQKCRTVYSNIIATHNLVSVCNCSGQDLEIKDTDKYEYILTYSFPCQDLSNAGLGKGMAKGSGTRSGLLWEVGRLLYECNEKPQILLMENVPEVICKKNIKHFAEWMTTLEKMGYKNYWKCLNAKHYGIPQNRNRCFMVSVLDDCYYDFPKHMPLKNKLEDLLETEVDEKYYLSDKIIDYFEKHTIECKEKGNGFKFEPTNGDCVGKAITTRAGARMDDNFIKEPDLKTKLCNELIASGKIKEYDVIRHSYSNNRLNNGEKNMGRKENHEGLSPTLDTRCDCLGVCVKYSKIQIDKNIKNSVSTVFQEEEEEAIIKSVEKNKELYKSRKGFSAENSLGIKCSPTLKAGNPNSYCIIKSKNKHLQKNIEKFGISNETVAIDTYNQTKSECMQTIRATINQRNADYIQHKYRIRKLSPKECFRLMGVKDEDFERIAKNQSNASLYHLAGDSIVTVCLMAIFGGMFENLDYIKKIDNYNGWWEND